MIRKDNGSNNSLFLSFQMGLSDGVFFMIKHTPLPNRNHPISSPVCPMGVADTLKPCQFSISRNRFLVVRILCLNHWVGKSWITGPIATTISSNLLLHKCTIQITLLLTGRWTGCQRNTKIALRRHLCIRAWVHTVVSGLYMAVSGVIQWLLGQEEVGKSYKNAFFVQF